MSVISLEKWREKQGKNRKSKSQSKLHTKLDQTGQTLIDPEVTEELLETLQELYRVLNYCHRRPFLTKSRFARRFADTIGLCASEGFITTKINNETWSNKWCITDIGLDAMYQMEIYDDGK